MSKDKKKFTFEVAYWHEHEVRIVPVCAEYFAITDIHTVFYVEDEITAVFSCVVYAKKLSEYQPHLNTAAPMSFTEAQLRLISDKATRISPKEKN